MLRDIKPAKFRSLANIFEVSEHFIPSTPLKISSPASLQATVVPSQHKPCHQAVSLDKVAYTKLVQFSITSGCSVHGKLAHAHMIKTAFIPCLFLQNSLINMYLKCGEVDFSLQMFGGMHERNVVTWNTLISGFIRMGCYYDAICVFNEAKFTGVKLNEFTYASMLSICSQTGALQLGKMIHGLIVSSGLGGRVILANSLVDMYSKCGRVDQAKLVFDKADELDDVSWNTLISGYARSGLNDEMLQIIVKMQRCGLKLSSYVLGSALKACCSNFTSSVRWGKSLHTCSLKLGWDLDVIVGTALLDMYAKIGDVDDAILIFCLLPNKNVVMYNAMIAGLFRGVNNCEKYAGKALQIFGEMQRLGLRPSEFTFSTLIKACVSYGKFEYGKQIHAHICKNNLQSDEFVGSALVEFYSLSGSVEDGLRCFNSTNKLDIVIWTSMIVGYAQNGQFEKALNLFCELLASGKKPDDFTFSITLSACGNLAAVRTGEQIQSFSIKFGISESVVVQNSLIYMYAKSGDIDAAILTFELARTPDEVSWSVMICSTAQHGYARKALSLFELMQDHGIQPNPIAFVGVLTACSHGGLIEEGLRYYESMRRDYDITPDEKHCSCMVDLLGRAGRLSEAENFIKDSDFSDSPVVWRALLGACRIHRKTTFGKRIADKVIELEPGVAASYVLLYNMYTDAGMKAPATRIRDIMKKRGVKKEPGLSWIDVGTRVHSFLAGDISHPQIEKIHARLEEILEKIKKMGYTNENFISHVTDQDARNNSKPNYHSEKLAVTFGIINLPPSAPVRVMKNLRVCQDCHLTMKLISKVEEREIILRDSIRFHHFREGSCSCGDYW